MLCWIWLMTTLTLALSSMWTKTGMLDFTLNVKFNIQHDTDDNTDSLSLSIYVCIHSHSGLYIHIYTFLYTYVHTLKTTDVCIYIYIHIYTCILLPSMITMILNMIFVGRCAARYKSFAIHHLCNVLLALYLSPTSWHTCVTSSSVNWKCGGYGE